MLKATFCLFFTLLVVSSLANDEVREKRFINRNDPLFGFTDVALGWQNFLSPLIRPLAAFCNMRIGTNQFVRLGNGRAYFISTATASWAAARSTCTGMGGHLLSVNNAVENGHIVAHLNSLGVAAQTSFWFGLNDQQAEGIFKHTFLGTLPAATFWNAGEPVAATAATFDCAAYTIIFAVPAGAAAGAPAVATGAVPWTTALCTDLNRFICELEAPCSYLATATNPGK